MVDAIFLKKSLKDLENRLAEEKMAASVAVVESFKASEEFKVSITEFYVSGFRAFC